MLHVLKYTHPIEGEIEQLFTMNERDTAVAIGRELQRKGWRPRLMVKSHDGQFTWLTSLFSQQRIAA